MKEGKVRGIGWGRGVGGRWKGSNWAPQEKLPSKIPALLGLNNEDIEKNFVGVFSSGKINKLIDFDKIMKERWY